MKNRFLVEMEAHRKMIHFEIDEVGTQRQNEIEEILEQISPEKNITRDFIDDIEYDSVEFIKAATKLQSKGNFIKKSHFFEVSYFSLWVKSPKSFWASFESVES